MGFIKLTREGGPVIVNTSAIESIFPYGDGACIWYRSAVFGDYGMEQPRQTVTETPEQITAKLIQAGEKVK